LLAGLRELPAAMHAVVVADRRSPRPRTDRLPNRRSWALVGNGVTASRRRSADQCFRSSYKSIACDATEDKKTFDLSAEPLILCARPGSPAPTRRRRQGARDLPRAQGRGDRDRDRRRDAAARRARDHLGPAVLRCSGSSSQPWGPSLRYEGGAGDRRDRAAASRARVRSSRRWSPAPRRRRPARRVNTGSSLSPPGFFEDCAHGIYDGRSTRALPFGWERSCATAPASSRSIRIAGVRQGRHPSTLVEDLTAGLTSVIEQLTRPIDAIKHQAKTVTVGISRSDETLLRVPLVQEVLAAAPRATACRTARCARSSTSIPRSSRCSVHPLPHRRRRGSRRRHDDQRRRSRLHRDIDPLAHRIVVGAARHEAPRRE